jgi:uncharacterized DUF497 family protein
MVLYDSSAMTIEEQIIADEPRFVTVGMDAFGRILAVVYSYRLDTIRLISARKATRRERTKYEEGI